MCGSKPSFSEVPVLVYLLGESHPPWSRRVSHTFSRTVLRWSVPGFMYVPLWPVLRLTPYPVFHCTPSWSHPPPHETCKSKIRVTPEGESQSVSVRLFLVSTGTVLPYVPSRPDVRPCGRSCPDRELVRPLFDSSTLKEGRTPNGTGDRDNLT